MSKARLTDDEKQRRKHERAAQRMNDRAAKQFGPLFSHLAPTYARDDAYWHWRANTSRGVELVHQACGPGVKALATVYARWFEHAAIRYCGGEVAERLKAKAIQTFGSSYPNYAYGFWESVLTGQAVVIAWHRIEDAAAPLGCRVVSDEYRLTDPPYTVQTFRAAFPVGACELGPEPDDGGLYEKVLSAFQGVV
jgi:hypothetical protein